MEKVDYRRAEHNRHDALLRCVGDEVTTDYESQQQYVEGSEVGEVIENERTGKNGQRVHFLDFLFPPPVRATETVRDPGEREDEAVPEEDDCAFDGGLERCFRDAVDALPEGGVAVLDEEREDDKACKTHDKGRFKETFWEDLREDILRHFAEMTSGRV